MSTLKISPDVLDVIKRGSVDGFLFRLPGNLERSLYVATNKVLTLAGGKWTSGKVKAHVFTKDPMQALGLAVSSGEIVDTKKARQAFYTPQDLADEVAFLADVSGRLVLEPSAGSGSIVSSCEKFGARRVDCFEIEPSCLPELKNGSRIVKICDFLQEYPIPQYERVVMNPPFTKGQAVHHIEHAFKWLSSGGILFSIVPDANNVKLESLGAQTVKRFPSGTFKSSGTMVATKLIKIILTS